MEKISVSAESIYPLGDSALVIHLGEQISPHIHKKVMAVRNLLISSMPVGLIECVPAFTTLTLHYDAWLMSEEGIVDPFEKLKSIIIKLTDKATITETVTGKTIDIPVLYGGADGPDLEVVSQHTGLSLDEVIEIHSSREYLVYMIGFLPGFPYLGGMSEKLKTPRKSTPRMKIAAGSVGIAGLQTGVYPLESPGGWQIIGKTSVKLFDPKRKTPSLLNPGDKIRFVPVRDL